MINSFPNSKIHQSYHRKSAYKLNLQFLSLSPPWAHYANHEAGYKARKRCHLPALFCTVQQEFAEGALKIAEKDTEVQESQFSACPISSRQLQIQRMI